MSTFIAIGVGQGDAFFLEKGDKTLLVDGGKSVSSFPGRFLKAAGRNHLDILVCTHNDSDHANGVLGFLRQKRFTADEVWLPASWMDNLQDLMINPEKFLKELIADIQRLDDHLARDLEAVGEMFTMIQTQKEGLIVEETAENLRRLVEQASEIYHLDLGKQFRTLYNLKLRNPKHRLTKEALVASNLIREIALSAFRSGSLVRWFDYIGDNGFTKASGGMTDLLVPINAVEVARIKRPKKSALEYISLTRVNQQSLVFASPNNEFSPFVLFTADSDLSFRQPIPWQDQMIITAPHHGSNSNNRAYWRFVHETPNKMDVVWVRSDKKSNARPSIAYIVVNGRKYCTLCRRSKLLKQDVLLTSSRFKNAWQPVHTQGCCCI